ncbi:MAG: PorV/PorQ family protein [Calditrichaeota bacterium]|nr:PorV/PorQ family protein [Calditrichota bacterium]
MRSVLQVAILVMLFFPGWSWGQSAGTTSFNFLKNQYSARGAALAGNLVAVKGDLNTLMYNPAGLTGLPKTQWMLGYVDHLLDFQGGQLAYGRVVPRWGTLGVWLVYFNYGRFEETDVFGEPTGKEFGASEMALGVTLSNVLGPNFDYGVSVKWIYSALDVYTASALAIDAGLIYTHPGIEGLRIGLSVSNVGIMLDKYTTVKESMPILIRVGFAKRLAHLPLLFTASLNDLTRSDGGPLWNRLKRFSVGGEFDVSQVIKLRFGYQNDVNQNVKPLGGRNFAGVTAGLGIVWRGFRLDYGYSSWGDLGSQNRLTVTGTF